MTTRLTVFTANLVQDTALSVSGLDRDTSSDQPFTLVDGVPLLTGRGLKGAAVAMARRFFADPLPGAITGDVKHQSAFRRSAWEFSNVRPSAGQTGLCQIRAGVGILQKTAARAEHVLYDREVMPAGTQWDFVVRVDWSRAESKAEALQAEGILGYVLKRHWSKERCWLGAAVARGLGWCHLEEKSLVAYRLDDDAYEKWLVSGREKIPVAKMSESDFPTAEPTRSWCFRSRDIDVCFGEYRPEPAKALWGLDMLAIGPHDLYASQQPVDAGGAWARPAWAAAGSAASSMATDRSILMERGSPLLSGSSVRGPMRHEFSRRQRAAGHPVKDPHEYQGKVGKSDPAGAVFGTVEDSSRILIRDARAESEWSAARLHMHAEDEFSAGSYGSAKRDAVRLLRGTFPIRVIVEGPDEATVAPVCREMDSLLALGTLGHLAVGGHKTRGAGWGRWILRTDAWDKSGDVLATVAATPAPAIAKRDEVPAKAVTDAKAAAGRLPTSMRTPAFVKVDPGQLTTQAALTLQSAANTAKKALQPLLTGNGLVAWWCEPSIDFDVTKAPQTFGRGWPDANLDGKVDEVVFFGSRACWRAARTATGWRSVLIHEVAEGQGGAGGAEPVTAVQASAQLLGPKFRKNRFPDVNLPNTLGIDVREWYADDQIVGFTLVERKNP